MDCLSCHKNVIGGIDREQPRTVCATCHTGYTDPVSKQMVIPQGKADCVSCHVQHIEDKRHWNPSLLTQSSKLVPQ
jgi:hypothetical protein